jgi:hypothetical protein
VDTKVIHGNTMGMNGCKYIKFSPSGKSIPSMQRFQ